MLGHYIIPGLSQGKLGCLPASHRHDYWAKMFFTVPKLPHPWSPTLLYLLTS